MNAILPVAASSRPVIHKTRGHGGGPIVRLMSPSDLGRHLKPFVFLDLFDAEASFASSGVGMHPHSGIATVTVVTDGDMAFDDPKDGKGMLSYGGVEWMRAGGGVWHGKELSGGTSPRFRGFQLWIALPPELENGPVESQYIEAPHIPQAGPAHVILGAHGGVQSPVKAPAGVNYLLVTLQPGESWRYDLPAGHDAAWVAVSKGRLEADHSIETGEMAIFGAGGSVELRAGPGSEAVFVLGSAIPHPHDLVLGNYSVHTTREALRLGEASIVEIGARLRASGLDGRSGSVPTFK